MSRPTIPGTLTVAALAALHRPRPAADLAAQIGRLHARGLTATEIAALVHLSVSSVIDVLAAIAIPEPTP